MIVSGAHVSEVVSDPEERREQGDRTLRSLGILIRTSIFSGQSPVPVEEMEDGLLHMLANDDITMWPVIRMHSSLLPIYSRVDCLLALHDELVKVVVSHPSHCRPTGMTCSCRTGTCLAKLALPPA